MRSGPRQPRLLRPAGSWSAEYLENAFSSLRLRLKQPQNFFALRVKVGSECGAEGAMYPSKNIVQKAVNSADHTTLVAAVKAVDLVDTLEGPGPFTVFAPNNRAFAALPAGTADSLLEPAQNAT